MRCVCCRASVAFAAALGTCMVAATSAHADDAVAQADFAAASSLAEVSLSSDDWMLPPDHETSFLNSAVETTPSAVLTPPALRSDAGTVAPLPPALLVGPLGVGLVGYATYRLRKRI